MSPGLVPSEAVKENVLPAPPPASGDSLAVSGVPWLPRLHSDLRHHLHMAFSQRISVSKFPLFIKGIKGPPYFRMTSS